MVLAAFLEIRLVTTRTIGPLHLEDLEPHRFEDLIRQLLYDFRQWRSLEATGRSGADDGFDARATEVATVEPVDRDADETDSDRVDAEARVWLVQCKREKAIGPKQLAGYLDDVADPARLYGIVFAAACDFSKTARDRFREKARELGFAEAHLWGKGEVEDMLFQPKNDHLLFAYFGVSLVTRHRTLRTEVRTKLATKRKALRVLKGRELNAVLLRDATDERYPWMDEDETKAPLERRRWNVMTYKGVFSDGLHFILHRHPAYIGDGGEWDFGEKFDSGPVRGLENPWRRGADIPDEVRTETFDIWDALPDRNKAWFLVYVVLPFENILDIDETGDEWFGEPHIYTTEFRAQRDPFCAFIEALEDNSGLGSPSIINQVIARIDRHPVSPDRNKRVKKFPGRDDRGPLPE
ncbi:restriction endonuclease [Nitrospirillum amazonense]|uniref:restriction endonuclease n=1 Tax=Nitrospirillum amazonense TaxID=28077 RepID=UPI002DD42C75|nr:restriction endonuclease [Nitrospirillum amazonense]MEC4589857.1 restriction endonuclease [Nitrospirillum amazonense]